VSKWSVFHKFKMANSFSCGLSLNHFQLGWLNLRWFWSWLVIRFELAANYFNSKWKMPPARCFWKSLVMSVWKKTFEFEPIFSKNECCWKGFSNMNAVTFYSPLTLTSDIMLLKIYGYIFDSKHNRVVWPQQLWVKQLEFYCYVS